MTIPMISVVMPVYNAEKYIVEAVDSILNQTYSDFEFIIIDDCSTDGSYEILQSYAAKDNRIRLFKNNVNNKLPKTLNFGISQAKGKYIARMDADDISLPERFSKQIEFMESHPEIGVCGSWLREFQNNDVNDIIRVSTDHVSNSEQLRILVLFAGCYIAHPTTLVRQSILKMHNYDINLSGDAEDYDLWSRLVNLGYNFANIPEVLLYYRKSDKQTSNVQREKIIYKTIQIISENYFYYFSKFISVKYLKKFVDFRFCQHNKVCFLFDLVFFELTLRKLIRVNFKYNLFEPTEFFSSFLLEQSWVRKKIIVVCRGISKWCLK
ncbi:MAG: glycosyltransferase [Burkholderiales bacterium]|nr:glycosyltransferase [Burkholderiales bacterium]